MQSADRSEYDALEIHTQADLQRLWELLMQPLGWRAMSLWVTFIAADRRPTKFLLEVAEHDSVPSEDDVANLYYVLDQLLRDEGELCTVAFLLARPGRGPLTAQDRLFGQRLLLGARRAGVPVEPVHVATDVAILALTPDDLAA
jgi:hypothetical protein